MPKVTLDNTMKKTCYNNTFLSGKKPFCAKERIIANFPTACNNVAHIADTFLVLIVISHALAPNTFNICMFILQASIAKHSKQYFDC